MTLARRFGGIFPKNFLNWLESRIVYAGFREEATVWVGSRFIVLLLYSFLAGLAYFYFTEFTQPIFTVAIAIGVALLIILLFYLNLYYRVLGRTRKLERLLPDFLFLIAANLRAGMTPFGSFVKALRPEFGDLYEEGKNAAAQVGGKRRLEDALEYLGGRFESQIFGRSLQLFLKGIRSGTQLARLLYTNAEEIRRIQDMREELVSTTRTYLIFISFVVVIIMPFLLSVSAFFLRVFLDIQGELGVGEQGGAPVALPLLIGKLQVTPDDVFQISLGTLIITSMLASALIGIIRTGKWVYGVKYFPFMAAAAIIFFFLADKGLNQIIQLQ